MIKLCFIEHSSEYKIFKLVAKSLHDRGFEAEFVCKSLGAYKQYLEAGFKSFFISEIFSDKGVISGKDIENLDIKYGPPGIRLIGDSDVQLKALYKNNENGKHQIIARAIMYWEKFFEEHKTQCVIARETATFATRTAYVVGRQMRIPIFWIDTAPKEDMFVMNDVEEKFQWKELREIFDGLSISINDKQRLAVDGYVKSMISEHAANTIVSHVSKRFLSDLRKWFGLFIRGYWGDRNIDPVVKGGFVFGQKKELKRILWNYVTKYFFSYDDMPKNEKFVYFPIYSGEEACHLTSDHFWARNEAALIKETAASLPVGFLLYVKEHPRNPGDLTFFELRRLKKESNIRILRPEVNSLELIRNCIAVVTLQGLTGWEAFLLKKPVVAVGVPFYSESELVYSVSKVSEMANVLWAAIKNGSVIYKQKIDDWYRFIYATLTSTGHGVFFRYRFPSGFPVDEQNAAVVAESIDKKVKLLIANK
jgi:hypothetical protein